MWFFTCQVDGGSLLDAIIMAMFPSIDYNLFIWKTTRLDDPSYYSRLAFSGETFGEVLNRFYSGAVNRTCSLAFKSPYPLPISLPVRGRLGKIHVSTSRQSLLKMNLIATGTQLSSIVEQKVLRRLKNG
jgi:hypothetical protein